MPQFIAQISADIPQTCTQNGAESPRLTSEQASAIAKLSHAPDANRKITPRMQAVDLQTALHEAGKAMRKSIKSCDDDRTRAQAASALASVAKGWQSMTDQLRIMSGKAAPGTLSPAERRAKAESKRPAAKRDGPRAARPAADSPASDNSSKESLS